MSRLAIEAKVAFIKIMPEFASIKDVRIAMLRNGIVSAKDLSHEVRLGIAQPYFERMFERNQQPVPVGADFGFYISLVQWFGEDVIASLIDSGLVDPEFDFSDRDKDTSLSDHLKNLAQVNGWKV
jgi:hypothetical protein